MVVRNAFRRAADVESPIRVVPLHWQCKLGLDRVEDGKEAER